MTRPGAVAGSRSRRVPLRPRAVVLGKSHVQDDPQPYVRAKYRLMAHHLDVTMIQLGRGRRDVEGVRVLPLPVQGPGPVASLAYYVLAPVLALREAVRRRPCAVLCQSPLEAAPLLALRALLPSSLRPRVVVEVHGDWRTATRLYGSPRRRLLAPLVDRLAARALRHADRVRAVGDHTTRLAVEAGYRGQVAVYPAWSDYDAVSSRAAEPPPAAPVVAFVGALEPTKGVDVLLQAWPQVRRSLPEAQLVLVGHGSMRRLVEDAASVPDAGLSVLGHIPRSDVARVLDGATLLVLPSRSEGLPLVLLEAMARGRAVVATRAGGIPELVEHGVNGLLVAPDDAAALAAALLSVLGDVELARSMGDAGRRAFAQRDPAGAYRRGVQDLAQWIAGQDPGAA